MTTIKFQRKGQPAKFIPNGLNYKGFLVSKYQKGVGMPIIKGGLNSYGEGETWEEYKSYRTTYRPYFDVDKMSEKEKATIKARNYKDIEDVIKDGLSHVLILFESNDRYSVVDTEVEKRKKEEEEGQSILNKKSPIKLYQNSFGIGLESRLPKSIFSLIEAHGRYWSASEIDEWNDDVDDFSKVGEGKYLKGWYFNEIIIEILKNAGYEVTLS